MSYGATKFCSLKKTKPFSSVVQSFYNGGAIDESYNDQLDLHSPNDFQHNTPSIGYNENLLYRVEIPHIRHQWILQEIVSLLIPKLIGRTVGEKRVIGFI